jgi:phospholipid/cholesterol/gamma-HCH transport system substrate-binding protein
MASGLTPAAVKETRVGRNIVETIVGALVLVVAGVFVFYAFSKSDRSGPDGYEVVARFGRIDGLKRGADVTLSGVKVGTVTGFVLDPKTYQAVVRLAVSSNVNLPSDTNAKIVSESLLGGVVVVLEPGNDKAMIRAGGEIAHTQDSIPLTELIAKFMFGSAGSK